MPDNIIADYLEVGKVYLIRLHGSERTFRAEVLSKDEGSCILRAFKGALSHTYYSEIAFVEESYFV